MGRFGWLLSVVAACAAPSDPAGSSEPVPNPIAEAVPDAPFVPIKGDDPRPRPAPAPGIACGRAATRSCGPDDMPLRCVAETGGAVWMADEACPAAHRCVPDHGCLPLPECTDVGLLGCVRQTLFVCEATPDAALAWSHATVCPPSIPCVNGRGCPNPHGVATPCTFVDPPRCTPDGRLMVCGLEGIDAIWGAPQDCGVGTRCVPGQGCRAPEEDDPDTPTTPPKGQRPSWR